MPANNIYTEPIGEQPEFSDSDLEKIRKHQASDLGKSYIFPVEIQICNTCGYETRYHHKPDNYSDVCPKCGASSFFLYDNVSE